MVIILNICPRSDLVEGRDEDLTTYRLQGGMISETSIGGMARAMRTGSLPG